ncbi:MAG TPA: RNA polymerase sigma factor [Polyangiaceae bacterium]|nr:RNA polymerase sigma factor [Polyangiaceae bacterium]
MQPQAQPPLPLAIAAKLTDEQLVQRIRSGDIALFEVLMRRNNTRLYRTLRSLLRNEAEIEDAMQAVYVIAYSKLGSFRGDAQLSTWLTQIALNEALGRLRHDRRHPALSLAAVPEPELPIGAPSVHTPEAHVNRRELAAILEEAVDALPELYRVTFMLREIDGMDTTQAAQALGVSEDVVKKRLSRARALLRAHVQKLFGSALPEAFGFHAVRCDRIVEAVMERLGTMHGT